MDNHPIYMLYETVPALPVVKEIPPILNPYHRKVMKKGYGFQKKGKKR